MKAVGEGIVDGRCPSFLSPGTKVRIEIDGTIAPGVPVVLGTWIGISQMWWASAALEDVDLAMGAAAVS